MNNKGLSKIETVLAIVILTIIVLSISKEVIAINKQSNLTAARIEMMNTAIEEFKIIQQRGYSVTKKKVNNTETHNVGDTEITIVYKSPLEDSSIPIEIMVKSTREPDAKPFIFENQIYATGLDYSSIYARISSLDSRITTLQNKISNLPR